MAVYGTFVCLDYGHVYDEGKGDADGGSPWGSRWEEVPDTWASCFCGAPKEFFQLMD